MEHSILLANAKQFVNHPSVCLLLSNDYNSIRKQCKVTECHLLTDDHSSIIMNKPLKPRLRLLHILAIIPIMLGISGIMQLPFDIQSLLLTDLTMALSFVAILALYILACTLSESISEGMWLGYVNLSVVVSWSAFGIQAAVLMIIVGSIVAPILFYTWTAKQPLSFRSMLPEALSHITMAGVSISVTHLTFSAFGGQVPLAQQQQILQWPLVLALVAGYIIMHGLSIGLADLPVKAHLGHIRKTTLFDNLLLVVALLMTIILYELGSVAFIIITMLVATHALRYRQMRYTQSTLMKRIQEMSLLNTLGHQITSPTRLEDVLETIYQAIHKFVDATTFFTALYNADQDTVEYPLFYENHQKYDWPTRKRAVGFTDHVINTRQTLIWSEEEGLAQFGPNFKANHPVKAYLAVPLMIGQKLIGVLGVADLHNSRAFDELDARVLQTVASQASLVLRNANLYSRTTKMADNLAYINQSLQNVMFNLDRDDALQTACKIARHVTSAQKAAIFLQNPDKAHDFQLIQSIGFAQNSLPVFSIPIRPNTFHEDPEIFDDLTAIDNKALKQDALACGYQALACIPLRSGTNAAGRLVVYHDTAHFYKSTEIDLLRMLANQVTAALDNAELLQALEMYASEQAQLVHLARISNYSLELERIIQDVCGAMIQMVDMRLIEVGLYISERDVFHLYRPSGFKDRLHSEAIALDAIPEFFDIHHMVNITSIQVRSPGHEANSKALNDFLVKRHYQTLAIVPMRINREVVGMILLADHESQQLTDNQYRIIEMATHQITTQLHNARIHTLTEEALVQRLEQLSLIEDIAQQISQSLDTDQIISNVLQAALQATQADFAAIGLQKREDEDAFKVTYQEIIDQQTQYGTLHLPGSQGITNLIAQTGETILIGDNQQHDAYMAPTEQHYRSSLAVPLRTSEKIIGVLDIESRQRNFFTSEQAGFLKSLAGHAAISIENANLLEERDDQINTLTLLRMLSLEAVSTTDKHKVHQAIVKTAIQLLHGDGGALFNYTNDSGQLHLLASQLPQNNGTKPKHTLPVLAYEAAQSGRTILIEDVRKDEAYKNLDTQLPGLYANYRALAIIPIRRRHAVRELLCICFNAAQQFSTSDLETIDLLAVQAASYLENTMLNETIRTANGRMRTILDSTRDGIVLLDHAHCLQDANIAAEHLLDLRLREHLQTPFLHVIEQAEAVNPELKQLAAAYSQSPQAIHEHEYEIGTLDHPIFVKTLISNVKNAEGDRIGQLLVLRDITEEKLLEDFRNKVQSMVIHDLHSPLSAIITSMYFASDILDEPDNHMPPDKALRETIEVSLESASNLLDLVETLRDLRNRESVRVEPGFISLQHLVDKSYNALLASIREANVRVEYDFAADVPPLYVDVNLARRVITNLMHNAYKFTPLNGKIRISSRRDPEQTGYARIQICDTGPGIPEAMREAIFDQFVQVKKNKPRIGGKGTGLGLSFCKLAVELHGGHIWVQAEGPLPGACLAFTLPYQEEPFNRLPHGTETS